MNKDEKKELPRVIFNDWPCKMKIVAKPIVFSGMAVRLGDHILPSAGY